MLEVPVRLADPVPELDVELGEPDGVDEIKETVAVLALEVSVELPDCEFEPLDEDRDELVAPLLSRNTTESTAVLG